MARPTKPPVAPAAQNVPELRFVLTPGDQQITEAALKSVQNDVLKSLQKHIGPNARLSWLEAGGYIKFSKTMANVGPGVGPIGPVDPNF